MQFTVTSNSPQATQNLADALAPLLSVGDVLLLHGVVGAGKTDLARKIIQNRMAKLDLLEDVPSPSFTLVQTYDLGETQFVHIDLYRLSNPDEVYELGIEQAFEEAICLIEWPSRLGEIAPKSALNIEISILGETERAFKFYWSNAADWDKISALRKFNLGNASE